MAGSESLFQGVGDIFITSLNAPRENSAEAQTNVLMIPAMLSLDLAPSVTKKTARKLANRKVVTAASTIGEVETTATIVFESLDKDTWAFCMNSQWVTGTNLVWPAKKTITVLTGAPPTHVDADITAANAADVLLFRQTDANDRGRGAMLQVPSAPEPGEYSIDSGTGTITFNVAEIGATIDMKVPKLYASGKTLLATPTPSFGNIKWEGDGYFLDGTEMGIRVHDMSPDGIPQQTFNEGLLTMSVTFTCNTPAGKPEPYEYIDMDSLVEPD